MKFAADLCRLTCRSGKFFFQRRGVYEYEHEHERMFPKSRLPGLEDYILHQ